MNNLKNIAATIAFALLSILANAQTVVVDNNNNDVMKSNGKIYVVMTIVIVIVVGLFLFLLNLDRKISKLEKEN